MISSPDFPALTTPHIGSLGFLAWLMVIFGEAPVDQNTEQDHVERLPPSAAGGSHTSAPPVVMSAVGQRMCAERLP